MRYKKSKKNDLSALPKSLRKADLDPSGLGHTKLERRRLLNADFGFDGTNFLIDNFADAGDNNIVISQDADNYIFTLDDGMWLGSNIGTDVVGSGTDTLMVDQSFAALVKIILESDNATQFDIEFDNFSFGGEFSITSDGGNPFGTVSQAAGTAITNSSLFDVSGALNIELNNAGNDFSIISIANADDVLLQDTNSVVLAGLTTNDDGDAKLTVGTNLEINGQIDLGGGNLFLDVDGNVTQTEQILPNEILANGLGLMVGGTTTLQNMSNHVSTLAIDNNGLTLYTDDGDVQIGSVTVYEMTDDEMTVTGITTTNADVKLDIDGFLQVNDAVNVGDGDVILRVRGNLTQTASITAHGLGLMVGETTTLQNMSNHVSTLAISNDGVTLYTDDGDVQIGSVTVAEMTDDEMTVTGITTTDADVKLDIDGFLQVNDAVNVGDGDVILRVRGDLTQTASIIAHGLGLMVGELTVLQDPTNNVEVLAFSNDGLTLYTDFHDVVVGEVTVDGMTITGGVTSNDDVKLTIVDGNLAIDKAINVGGGNLFLAVAGNVTQTEQILANGLGLMVGGTTTLQNMSNHVSMLAADNDGETLYTDDGDVQIGSVTVDGMMVTGITATGDDVKLDIDGYLQVNAAINVGDGDVILRVRDDLTQTASITAHGLGLMVGELTVLQDPTNNVEVLAFSNDGLTLYTDFHDVVVGEVTVDGMTITGGVTSNDDVKLTIVDGNLAIDKAINVGGGNLFLAVAGNVTQTEQILANGLGLMVGGTTTLQNMSNHVSMLAADNDGETLYTDDGDVQIGSVTVDGMMVTGITATGDDVKLDIDGYLQVNAAINVGDGDVILRVRDDLTQTASITAHGLGLMVGELTVLQDPTNNVEVLAFSNDGLTLYTDFHDVVVGEVTVDGMTITGGVTSNDDVKLTIVDGNLAIDKAINVGGGNLFLAVAGNVTQTEQILANGLGLMVGGTTTLQNMSNHVSTLAADNDGETLYTDDGDVQIGSVTVAGMSVTGITTTDDNVKLDIDGSLQVNAAIDVGMADVILRVRGDLTQTSSITAHGLGLMVGELTELQNANNNVEVLAFSNDGLTLYTDFDDVVVGEVIVDGMTITGGVTSDDDVKLTIGGDLAIDEAINLGDGNLFLAVAGNVTQTEEILANGLGLMVDGTTTLQNMSNHVSTLAADNDGETLYTDDGDVQIGSVTVAGMSVTGITTTDDNVKLDIDGSLQVNAAIDVGMADVILRVRGDLTQTSSITAHGLGLMVGELTELQNANNNVEVLAFSNDGLTLYTDFDDVVVGEVIVDGMTITGGVTSDDDVKLTIGGDLAIEEAINTGTANVFLDVGGNVTQTATGTITAAGLGLMVDGTTTLDDGNDVDIFAADNGGFTLFNDIDGLTVGSVTVDVMTVTGITTSDDDAKLITGGDLAINEAISLGMGDLFLAVTGNVTQTAAIQADGLGLMVSGSTTLQNPANDVNQFAADNGGTTQFTDANGFNVGVVTVDGMTVKGVGITGDFVLIASGDISQDINAPVIVSGLTDVTTTGDLCWTFGDCFGPEGDLPDGQNDNDFNLVRILAANAEIVDRDQMIVSLAVVTGQLRLAAGDAVAGGLMLTGNISAGDQILLQASAGVNQTAGILTTDQLLIGGDLGKESTGDFILQADNVINEVAAQVIGDLRLTNIGDLNIGVLDYSSVCGTQQALSGLSVSGNLVIDVDASLVAETGHLTQSVGAPVLVTGTTDLNATGNIILLGDDRDPADGGNGNDFQGVVNLNDDPALDGANRDYVEIADINQLIVEDANANDGIHLFAGTAVSGSLNLIGAVTSPNVLLQSSGGVDQDAANGVVTANELIVGGDQVVEGTGAFVLQGQNEVDQLVGNLLNGSLQLQNLNALTVSSGLSFIGSDGIQTDAATGLFAGGDGAALAFADPNLALANTAQGINNDGQYNPAFGQYLDTSDVGIAILNQNVMTIETGAVVNAVTADIYLETVGDNDLMIEDTVRVDDVGNRILVVAGGELQLEPNGRLERGAAGLITTLFNDVTLQDPTGSPADQNALIDLNSLTQTLQFIFGDAGESNFDASVFWGIMGEDDNSFTFDSLNPTQLSALDDLLFGASSTSGFESRSFYETLNFGNTSETVQSQPIGNLFDNSGTISDALFVPSASFTLDFLRTNPEFRSIVVVFNDANINLFQNASGAIEDLNVATADFEGLARFAEPVRITITRPDIDIATQIEVIPQPEVQIFETSFLSEEPLFVQTVQEKFYIIVYFDSQFEADLFEAEFGDDERDFQEVLELLEELGLEDDFLEWRTSGESDSLDANKIREIMLRADLDLEENEVWVKRFEQWLRAKADASDDIPDVPRGVYKILEVDNGKTIILGDDIDRKFVPEPEQNDDAVVDPELNGESTESGTQTLLIPERDGVSSLNGVEVQRNFGGGIDSGEIGSATNQPFKSSAAPLVGLLAALTHRRIRQDANAPTSLNENEGSSLMAEKTASLDRNIFSSSARFRRRSNRGF